MQRTAKLLIRLEEHEGTCLCTAHFHVAKPYFSHGQCQYNENDNTLPLSCRGKITMSNIDEICPLAIPNQISTISMHIPSLVKIHWCLLKLSSGNGKRIDGCKTDGRTDRHTDVQRETIIPLHYRVGGGGGGIKRCLCVIWRMQSPDQSASLLSQAAYRNTEYSTIQLTLVVLTSLNSNNCLSRNENLVPVLPWKSNNR